MLYISIKVTYFIQGVYPDPDWFQLFLESWTNLQTLLTWSSTGFLPCVAYFLQFYQNLFAQTYLFATKTDFRALYQNFGVKNVF